MVTSMRIAAATVTLVVLFAPDFAHVRAARPPEGPPQSTRSTAASDIVATYCGGCHNGTMRSPTGAVLDTLDLARAAENPDVWTRAYRQLQAGTMPPVGAPRPDRRSYDAVLASIEAASGANAPPRSDAPAQQIAERLARLLWNSTPDASLLDDATRGRLASSAAVERQIARMLSDARAEAFVQRFLFPWLGLDRLAQAEPDKAHFPDYETALRDSMARETALFLLSQLREDRDPIALWTANYTFLNEQLARHYGVSGVTGPEFRRVVLASPERAGLLGHASVLMVTSKHQKGSDVPYTSPATRALWVRTRFLGAAAPQPFPGAQPVDPELPITPQTRRLPAQPCANCHRNFFPLGYALENFDAIGRWRTRDQAGPIDASGTFVDGTPTNGVVELRNVLLERPDAFRTTVTEQLILYAASRPLGPSRVTPDTLVRARQILHSATPVRWSSLIASVVRADPEP
jgi:mono/diheme cytochrome c family protein